MKGSAKICIDGTPLNDPIARLGLATLRLATLCVRSPSMLDRSDRLDGFDRAGVALRVVGLRFNLWKHLPRIGDSDRRGGVGLIGARFAETRASRSPVVSTRPGRRVAVARVRCG